MSEQDKGGHCSMGAGCDETGVCYAGAHGEPELCPKATHESFTVRPTSYLRNLTREEISNAVAVHYQPAPKRSADGKSTSISLCFPFLIIADYVQDKEAVAAKVAAILNEYWEEQP